MSDFNIADIPAALLQYTPGFESGNRVFQSLLALEQATIEVYTKTQVLVSTGRLTEAEQNKVIAEYDQQRLKLYTLEMTMYAQCVNAIYQASAGTVQGIPWVGDAANYGFQRILSEFPQPQLLPEITRGATLSGLGIAPLIIGGVVIAPWVVVLFAVASVAVIIAGLYFAATVLSDIVSETAHTKRREYGLDEYMKCIERGRTIAECKEAIPDEPQRSGTSGWVWVLAGAGVLALLGGGAYVYTQSKKTPRLAGRYNLEV